MTRVTPGQFARHLRVFADRDLRPCALGEYLENPRPSRIALTFDDGYESFLRYAYPALKERGGSATVFIVAGYAGGWNRWEVNLGALRFKHLSWEQLRAMEGIEVGSHTMTHRCLVGLPEGELRRELTDSKAVIEDRLGCPVNYLSLPFGRFDRRVIEIAREAGYLAACTMNPLERENGFLVGRRGVYLLDTETALCRKLNGAACSLEMLKLRTINRFSGGTILVKKLLGNR